MSIELAKYLALKYHAGQMYGDLPYSHHLQEVADSVAAGTTDERLIQVAWLHDILEDTPMQLLTLHTLFEDNVAQAVEAMTRKQGMEKSLYLATCKANPMARMAKIHDSLCNLRASVMRFDQKRIRKYTEQIGYLVG